MRTYVKNTEISQINYLMLTSQTSRISWTNLTQNEQKEINTKNKGQSQNWDKKSKQSMKQKSGSLKRKTRSRSPWKSD
jgi:hypothetical protein